MYANLCGWLSWKHCGEIKRTKSGTSCAWSKKNTAVRVNRTQFQSRRRQILTTFDLRVPYCLVYETHSCTRHTPRFGLFSGTKVHLQDSKFILMYKMHPFFWCSILGQWSASYTWDGTADIYSQDAYRPLTLIVVQFPAQQFHWQRTRGESTSTKFSVKQRGATSGLIRCRARQAVHETVCIETMPKELAPCYQGIDTQAKQTWPNSWTGYAAQMGTIGLETAADADATARVNILEQIRLAWDTFAGRLCNTHVYTTINWWTITTVRIYLKKHSFYLFLQVWWSWIYNSLTLSACFYPYFFQIVLSNNYLQSPVM